MEKKLYTIYYLPHVIREGYVNSKGEQQIGKVGCTTEIEERLSNYKPNERIECKILHQDIMYMKDALTLEKEFQIQYDLIDGSGQPSVKKKLSKPCSEETKRKLSGKLVTEETRQKIRDRLTGKPKSPEHIQRFRDRHEQNRQKLK